MRSRYSVFGRGSVRLSVDFYIRRRQPRCGLVVGIQTCALPITSDARAVSLARASFFCRAAASGLSEHIWVITPDRREDDAADTQRRRRSVANPRSVAIKRSIIGTAIFSGAIGAARPLAFACTSA